MSLAPRKMLFYRQNTQTNPGCPQECRKKFGKLPCVGGKIIHNRSQNEQQCCDRQGNPPGAFSGVGLCRTGTATMDAELVFVVQISAAGSTVHCHHLIFRI